MNNCWKTCLLGLFIVAFWPLFTFANDTWSLNTPTDNKITITYHYGDSLHFDGKSRLNTKLTLFNGNLLDNDFEISFSVKDGSYLPDKDERNNILSLMYEVNKPRQGFNLKKVATGGVVLPWYDLQVNVDSKQTIRLVHHIENETWDMKISRINNIFSYNDTEITSFDKLSAPFDYPLSIGSSLDRNKKAQRFWSGTLENLEIKITYDSKDEIELFDPARTKDIFLWRYTAEKEKIVNTDAISGDTILYAKWNHWEDIGEERYVVTYVYDLPSSMQFSGQEYIDTDLKLFSDQFINHPFKIKTNIDDFEAKEWHSTVFSCMDETVTNYPWIIYRYIGGDTKKWNIDVGSSKHQIIHDFYPESTGAIISRKNHIITIHNGSRTGIDDLPNTFDVPLTFWASINTGGNPFRFFKGKLSNTQVQIGYQEGEKAYIPEPKGSGYYFDGWFTDSEFENSLGTNIMTGITLYAKWTDQPRYYVETYLQNRDGTYTLNKKEKRQAWLSTNIILQNEDLISPEGYTFDESFSWNILTWTITGDLTLTLKRYFQKPIHIQFLNDDENTVVSPLKEYHAGTTFNEIERPAVNPTKSEDEKGTYTFSWWKIQGTDDIFTFPNDIISWDITFIAVYDMTLKKYPIYWKTENGNTFDTTLVEYGQIPSHSTPTKDSNDIYTYTFSWWVPQIIPVTETWEYTATFASEIRNYTVTFQDNDGNIISTGSYPYGTETGNLMIPTIQTTSGVTFAGRFPFLSKVIKDATYQTKYCKECNPGTWATCILKIQENLTCTYETACIQGYQSLKGAGTYQPSCSIIPLSTNHFGRSSGGIKLKKDNCPNGDYSDSYYDNSCGSNSNKEEDPNNEMINLYERAKEHELTSMENIDDFRGNDPLKRAEMAKIVTIFVKDYLLKTEENYQEQCAAFPDIEDITSDLHGYIIDVCNLWIMGRTADGNDVNEIFTPRNNVETAEAVTILSRIFWGHQYHNTPEQERYEWHLNHLISLGIINDHKDIHEIFTRKDFYSTLRDIYLWNV